MTAGGTLLLIGTLEAEGKFLREFSSRSPHPVNRAAAGAGRITPANEPA